MDRNHETPTERYCRKIQVVLSSYYDKRKSIEDWKHSSINGVTSREEAIAIRDEAERKMAEAMEEKDKKAMYLQEILKEELHEEIEKIDI